LHEGAERRLITRIERLLAQAYEVADKRAGEQLTEIERNFAERVRTSPISRGHLAQCV